MRHLIKPIPCIGLGLLMLAGGCTVSIQPWTRPAPPPSATTDPGSPHPGAVPFNSPPPRPLPANLNSPGEGTSQLIQKLNESEDQRRALQDQVLTLKKQNKEHQENLRVATYEVEESSKNLKRTRDELRQWQTEMDELRERVRKLEEYRATLKPLIEETLHLLNREQGGPGTPKALPTN